jgi:hypothetical protein
MAKVGVTLKIDVSKIDKSKLFKGQKGTYLDAQVFIDLSELDQYGNSGMITQAVSKGDRQSGQQGAILGNAKVFWSDSGQQQQPQQTQQRAQQQKPQYNDVPMDFDDDIHFAQHWKQFGKKALHSI